MIPIKTNKWRVRITTQKGRKHLGRFTDLALVIQTYNLAALMYHGEFAYLNEIPEIAYRFRP